LSLIFWDQSNLPWSILLSGIDVANIERLESIYPHYHDIDLIIGGLAERPLSGQSTPRVILLDCLEEQHFMVITSN
jgi:hypothetical protein